MIQMEHGPVKVLLDTLNKQQAEHAKLEEVIANPNSTAAEKLAAERLLPIVWADIEALRLKLDGTG
jgi:hypothetical protein